MAQSRKWTLTDVDKGVWVEEVEIGPADLGLPAAPAWSIRKKVLRGGLSHGVEVVEVDNGTLSFAVLPTRGMGIWKGRCQGLDIGWRSPVKGPVHPHFVDLQDRGGLGWLAGFDEAIVRCGLDSMGAPGVDVVPNNMGVPSPVQLTLHGKIANVPAARVEVEVAPGDPPELAILGEVHEAGLFCPQYRLRTRISTRIGTRALRIEDEIANMKGIDAEMELLYHCNFGPPFLEEGARLVAPARQVVPRDGRAAEDMDAFDTYLGPTPGYVEQVYWYVLLGGADGSTLTMLRNARGDRGLVLRFNRNELPAFTQWKNTASEADGYATGLEPGTAFPNAKAFERRQGRLVRMGPGERYRVALGVEVCLGREAVSQIEAEVEALQRGIERQVHARPLAAYTDLS